MTSSVELDADTPVGGAGVARGGAEPTDCAGAAVDAPSPCGWGRGGSTAFAGAADSAAAGAGCCVPEAAGCVAAPPITATTLLTATVSPSLTRISDKTPAAGDGISAS